MAVDTRDKRSSALNYQQPSLWLFPNPDGSLATTADRQHVGHIYSGITVGAAASAEVVLIQSATIGVPYCTATIGVPNSTATTGVPTATGSVKL